MKLSGHIHTFRKRSVDFSHLRTATDIQHFLEAQAAQMTKDFLPLIQEAAAWPVFFVEGVQSKMNDPKFKVMEGKTLPKTKNAA